MSDAGNYFFLYRRVLRSSASINLVDEVLVAFLCAGLALRFVRRELELDRNGCVR